MHKVSIIPRGRAGGYTLMLPKEDRYYATRSELLAQLKVFLGGRVAEAVVLNEISTGAQNDIERATELVRKMICEYGMSETMGPIAFGKKQEQVFLGRDISRDRNYSEEVAHSIDKEVRKMVEEAYNGVESILRENIEQLHVIAAALIEKETLEAEELLRLVQMEDAAVPAEESEASVEEATAATAEEAPVETVLVTEEPKLENQPNAVY